MKKAITVILWVLLICGLILLGVATYFTTSGINEWWNENVSQWIGGASLSVCATTLIQIVVNYTSKSNLDLGIRNLDKTSKEFKEVATTQNENVNSEVEKLKEIVINQNRQIETLTNAISSLTNNLANENERFDKLNEQYANSLMKMQKVNRKINALARNQVEIAKYDEKLVKYGVTNKLQKDLDEAENNE